LAAHGSHRIGDRQQSICLAIDNRNEIDVAIVLTAKK